MLKAYKYRLYPDKKQVELINKHIGCSRFVYNIALEVKSNAYKANKTNLSCFDLIKQLPGLKQECEWLTEVNSQTLQAAVKNLDTAYKNFFRGSGYPKYKSKWKGNQSFNIPQSVKLKDGKLYIPKFKGGIKLKLHRPIKGSIRQATISRTPTGKYFVSILCDTGENSKLKNKITQENTLGIDLGIKDFLVTSDGEVVDKPKHLYVLESRIKYIQRKYSRYKGKKTKYCLARLHERVANKRKDFLHKLSSMLVSENQSLAIEDLHVKGMIKNHCLAKSISDVGWSMFTTMLQYKCDWYGVNLLKVNRFYPSSKTCNKCGSINKDLTLKDREWTCSKCNTTHDRDINAAINIKKMVSGTDTKNQDELPTLVGV
jgi:putative transposase